MINRRDILLGAIALPFIPLDVAAEDEGKRGDYQLRKVEGRLEFFIDYQLRKIPPYNKIPLCIVFEDGVATLDNDLPASYIANLICKNSQYTSIVISDYPKAGFTNTKNKIILLKRICVE